MLEPMEAAQNWDHYAPMLARVFERFDLGYSTDDVLLDVIKQRKQLWDLGGEACAVVNVCKMPQFSVLEVPLLAGDNIDQWLPDLVENLKMVARDNGCKYVDGFGRKGWTRKLEQYGFKPYSYDVRLEIE